ncbi:hypothetical protein [Catellatospora citrea]|uniref:hypothetical protein n=1 Tax=Catellatospora citrea TaxID=53366 RepID=UPI000E7197FF|nr:hypothetical protein [Catellatospora citrea]
MRDELAEAGVSADSASATLYLLLDARIVDLVQGQWRFTVRLTDGSDETLRRLSQNWPIPAPVAEPSAAAIAAKNKELGLAQAPAWHEQPTGFFRGVIAGLRALQ